MLLRLRARATRLDRCSYRRSAHPSLHRASSESAVAVDPQAIRAALTRMYNDIASFLPDVVNGLIVLLVGYLIARIIGWLVRLVLRKAGLDDLSERRGIVSGL